MNPQERILFLRKELNRHNHNYYVNNAPEITDREFDLLMRELEDLEKAHPEFDDPLSPTKRVGSDLTKGFEHVVHERPMMSLANTYSIDEVDDWFMRISKALEGQDYDIVGEMKFDGTSISITYEHGRMVRAVTRGDGTQGDDVTANVMTIRSVPLELLPGDWPDKFEIRGEILMPWHVFEKLNAERAANEEPLFANPRNAASGTLKTQDSREVARRHLDARFYYLLGDNLPFDNHYENMLAAQHWGFKVSKAMTTMKTLKEVDDFIAYWDEHRKELPVATDGLVFKVNSLRQQLNLGSTAKSPLSGTFVKRASLHNDDIMQELDIHEDDWLYVEKAGEIIPQIVGVDKEHRNPEAGRIKFVTHCPECGTKLERIYGEAAWCCPNKYGCPPQITGRITHFCARRMMNIDGIGEETAELLYKAGLVENIGQIYDLTVDKLARLDRIGEKTAQRIVKGIEDSKSVPFERVLYALSIPNVGETTAKRLATGVISMDNLLSMSVEQIAAIQDIGPVIAEGIYTFLREPQNVLNIEALTKAGVTMQVDEAKLAPTGTALEGKTIVISGTFSHHSRDEYKEIITREGGKNAGSISKKTSFVLAGENMGPAKRDKCDKLGIPMLTEDEFLALLNE